MSNLKLPVALVSLVCGLCIYATVAAVEQIHIQADYMQFDINTGNSLYQGNVRFIQGKIDLSGDQVNVRSKDGKVIRVQVTGTPARYHDSTENGRILAESEHMDYAVIDNKLTMQGTARLEQDARVVQSQQIIYDTEKKLILAGKTSGKNGDNTDRVNITLTPKKDRPAGP